MTKESDITKDVPSELVTQYHYIMFLIALAATVVLLGVELYVMSKSPRKGFMLFLRTAPTLILAVLNTMFLYIMSVRTLH